MIKKCKKLIKATLGIFNFKLVKIKGKCNNEWLFDANYDVIVDIGASVGKFSLEFLKQSKKISVFAFEPIPESFTKLKVNLGLYENVHFFDCAIGDISGKIEFNLSSHHTSSSILQMETLHKAAFPHSAEERKIMINIEKLDDIIDVRFLQNKNVLIKIDVQGYEAQVIKGGEQTLLLADTLITEMSFEELYEGQKLFDDVYSKLKDLGYVYKGNLSQIFNPLDGRVLQANAIFVNVKKSQRASN